MIFLFLIFLIIFEARSAYAIPTPTSLIFYTQIMHNFAAVSLGYGLFLLSILVKKRNLLSIVKRTLFPAVLFLICFITLHFTLPPPTFKQEIYPEKSLRERLNSLTIVDKDLSTAYGLPLGSILIDPRPQSSYNSYHLKGSNNFSLSEIQNNKNVQRILSRKTKTIYLIDDRTFDPWAVSYFQFSKFLLFTPYQGGLNRHYKPNGKRSGFGEKTNYIINGRGEFIHTTRGKQWHIGSYTSLIANNSYWKRLPLATIPYALKKGVTVIDVRNDKNNQHQKIPEGSITQGLINIPPWNAYAKNIKKLLGKNPKQIVFVVDNNPDFLPAEGLAVKYEKIGSSVLGYVQAEIPSTKFKNISYLCPSASKKTAALILIFIFIFPFLFAFLSFILLKKYQPNWLQYLLLINSTVAIITYIITLNITKLFTSEFLHYPFYTISLVDSHAAGYTAFRIISIILIVMGIDHFFNKAALFKKIAFLVFFVVLLQTKLLITLIRTSLFDFFIFGLLLVGQIIIQLIFNRLIYQKPLQ